MTGQGGLDQSGQPDDDRPVGRSKAPDPVDTRLSYATEGDDQGEGSKEGDDQGEGSKEGPSASREWKQVKRKRGEQSGQSDASEVEENLFANTGSDNDRGNNRYFHPWFNNDGDASDEQQDRDAAEETETSEDPESDITSRPKKPTKRKHRKGKSPKRREDRKGKQPV